MFKEMSESEKLPRVQLRSFQKLDCNFNERDGVFVHHKALVLFTVLDQKRQKLAAAAKTEEKQ